MSINSVLYSEKRLIKLSASAFAVSKEVKQGMECSTAKRRIFTLSKLGKRPLEEVEII